MSHATPPVSRRDRRAQARTDRPVGTRRKPTRRAQPRPAWQSPVVLTSLGALLIGAAIIAYAGGLFSSGTPAELVTPPTSYGSLTVSGESVGSADAPVVMQVFSDFQCPACKAFITTELPSLIIDFVQPGLLRIESNDIDIIDRSGSTELLNLAVGAACAAQQGKYWEYHDLVFWNQGGENKGYHDAAFIARVATAAGVDMTAWTTCIANPDLAKQVQDRTTSAAASGVNQTPTLLVNGQVVAGVPEYASLHTMITQLLASHTAAPSAGPSPAASPIAS